MYQVITMYGDYEPWWFLDNWQKDIEGKKEFSDFLKAKAYFQEKSQELEKIYPYTKTKDFFLTAFWQEEDLRWCEECEDELQQYHGLLLLKDGEKINESGDLLIEKKVSLTFGKICPINHG